MLHALLRYGAENRGWHVQVITDQLPERNDEWQGIPVRHDRNVQRLAVEYRFSDVIITHLDTTRKAMELSSRAGRPLVHLVHNDRQLAYHHVQRRHAALAVFNSQWLLDAVAWQGPSTVLHPPTRIEDYAVEKPGRAVSLLNLSEAKGSRTFYSVAQSNPSLDFLAVKGAYAPQILPPKEALNIRLVENQADAREVYKRTKVLMVPSHYESWGRVAVEAACSGIPSVCSPTPGLLEAGVAAAYCDPDDTAAWNKAVRRLMRSPDAWRKASKKALRRAQELDVIAEEQLLDLAERIEGLV